jgi:EAL domain-containing protein (putative c-di-GMP-specific phosphodiesterase class I)
MRIEYGQGYFLGTPSPAIRDAAVSDPAGSDFLRQEGAS